jgi:Xaa-Pro aminopeptidase
LNLRGVDIPFNPLFHAYLFVSLEKTILFLDASKVDETVEKYLEKMGVERRNYTDLWPFMRKREWGEGKIIIPASTSYAISLMLTHFRYTISPNRVEFLMAIKNETEIAGLRQAYIRDGVAFVRLLMSLLIANVKPYLLIFRFNSLLGWKINLIRDMISRNGKQAGGLKSLE